MAKVKDLIGKQYGCLTVVRRDGYNTYGNATWFCECICGETNCKREVSFPGGSLQAGRIRMCKDLSKKKKIVQKGRHGKSYTPEYGVWNAMIHRCYNPDRKDYEHYGGRGITVSERWRNSVEIFIEDMGERPSPLHTLERIENNLGYSKDNCKWATMSEQNKNRRPHKKRHSQNKE